MKLRITSIIIIISLLVCLFYSNCVFAYENAEKAVSDYFDGTSFVEQGYNKLKADVSNCRFCYAYDYDGDSLQEGYAISGIWEEGIVNGKLWFINSDGTYTMVKEGIDCQADLFNPELVYAGNQVFLVCNQMKDGYVTSLICGYRNGIAYFPAISEQVSSFHSENGHHYAYNLTDYSGMELFYDESTGEFTSDFRISSQKSYSAYTGKWNWENSSPLLPNQENWYTYDEAWVNITDINNSEVTYEFYHQKGGAHLYVYDVCKGTLNGNIVSATTNARKVAGDTVLAEFRITLTFYDSYVYVESYNLSENTMAFEGKCFMDGYTYGNIENVKNDITIKMDGEEIYCEQPPVIINDTTLVPLRAISEGMGYEVEWNGEDQSVTIIDNGKGGGAGMTMYIGDTELITGGGVKQMPVAPMIINDRTMVPIRVIAEVLLCTVEWDGENQTVNIYTTYRPTTKS